MTPVHEVIKAFLEWRDNGNRALAEEFTRDEIVHAMVKEKIRPNTGDHELHLLMTMRLEELKDLEIQKREPREISPLNGDVHTTTNHVFISYVHENEQEVQKLCAELTRRGVEVWLDKTKIKPGYDWKDAIDEAIERGDFFLACFSEEYNQKNETYMTEELNLAIERLRKQPRSRAWFIPVLLSGQIPNWRIRPGQKLHDIQWVELNEANWDQGIRRILQVIQPPIRLRSEPIENLSEKKVRAMIRRRGFFDNEGNWDGQGLMHQYEETERSGKKLVIDHTTGLTWQQSGSRKAIRGKDVSDYIKQLNQHNFAGYSDWRLPTLEEAMSLIEPKKNKRGQYVAAIFNEEQWYILTADTHTVELEDYWIPWLVHFHSGTCEFTSLGDFSTVFIRAVRSGQSQ